MPKQMQTPGQRLRNPACLGHADPVLLKDPSFNLAALRRNSMARHHVAPELWHKRSFLLDAVEPFGLVAKAPGGPKTSP